MSQPQEYGVAAGRPALHKEYRDPLGRSLSGVAYVRQGEGASVELPVLDGVLSAELAPGQYHILAALETPQGQTLYFTDDIEVGAYG
jgi:hypothetical protein